MAEKMLVSASTGVMNSLLGKLATLMGEEYIKLKDLRKQVAFLHEELSSMAALLKDLADMEGLDNQAKQRRNRVREMSYNIEDCLDDFTRRVEAPMTVKRILAPDKDAKGAPGCRVELASDGLQGRGRRT